MPNPSSRISFVHGERFVQQVEEPIYVHVDRHFTIGVIASHDRGCVFKLSARRPDLAAIDVAIVANSHGTSVRAMQLDLNIHLAQREEVGRDESRNGEGIMERRPLEAECLVCRYSIVIDQIGYNAGE